MFHLNTPLTFRDGIPKSVKIMSLRKWYQSYKLALVHEISLYSQASLSILQSIGKQINFGRAS
jgi:hypothetical protein